MMKRSLYLMIMFALSLALVLSACAPAAAPDLDGTEWQLVELNASSLPVYVKIMLSFKDGQAGGQGACNGYGADYTQDGYTLALQPAVSTLMYCEGVMEYETSYLQAFNQVKSFQLENDQLSLLDENDNVLLVFGKPQAAPALDGTSWNATQVGDLPVPEGVTVSLNFAEGQLTGKAACNSYFAGYSQQEDRLTIENPGATEMYCEDEIRMELERAFLDILPNVRSFQIQMGGLVLLDESGMPLIFVRP
jgi:heat shock protein HslJ